MLKPVTTRSGRPWAVCRLCSSWKMLMLVGHLHVQSPFGIATHTAQVFPLFLLVVVGPVPHAWHVADQLLFFFDM